MTKNHNVYDTDHHFKIDPLTRAISTTAQKVTLIQGDHNSERFTFEAPRFIEGHDMSLCNKVQIHFINIDQMTKVQSADIYEPSDFQISPEDGNVVTFSWLIPQRATKYAGALNFVARFACMTADKVEYAWNTAVYSGISVSNGIDNSEPMVDQYSDVLEKWYFELISAGTMGINLVTAVQNEALELVTQGKQEIEIKKAEIDAAQKKMLEEIEKAADIVQEPGDSETAVMSQKAVTANLNEFDEYAVRLLECLEKVAWAVDNGQKYCDSLRLLLTAQTVGSTVFTVDDEFIADGFITDDGSVNTEIDAGYNFFWDKFVKAYAFALRDEINRPVEVTYRYAAYDEDHNFISRGYDAPAAVLLLTALQAPFYKIGFKNTTDYKVSKALIASNTLASLCSIENTTLNTKGEAEASPGRVSSEFFKIQANDQVLMHSITSVVIMCIYDKNLDLIDRQVLTADDTYTKIIQVPEGAKFCRVCTTPASMVYTSLELQV